jgi:PAS domain S-box-containing protein
MVPKFIGATSLKSRVVLLVLVLLLAGIWGLAARVTAVLQADLESLLSDQLLTTVSYVAADIDSNIKLRLDTLNEIAASITPETLADPAKVQRLLEQRTVPTALFPTGVFVADRQGTNIADYPRVAGRQGAFIGDREYFREIMSSRELAVSAPVAGRFAKQPVIALAVPLRDASRNPAGALVAAAFPSDPALFGLLEQTKIGRSGYALVAAPKERVFVSATDKSRILQPLPAKGINPLFDRRLYEGFEGAGVVTSSLGVNVLTANRNLKTTGWVVVAAIPIDEAFAPIAALKRQIYLAALLLSLAALLILRRELGRQLAPLAQAGAAMQRMTEGKEPFAPLPVKRNDEIGALLANFNRLMVERERLEKNLRESQERFRDLATLSSDWYWEQDADLRFSRMSEEIYPKSRLRPETTLGKLRWELPIASVSEERWRAHRQQLERREPFSDFVYQMINEDGERRWFSINGKPLFGGSGEFLGYRGTGRDITEQKNAQDALRQHEEHVRVLFDSLPIAVGHADHDLRITFVNRMYHTEYGGEGDPVGKTVREVVGEERYAITGPYMVRALAGEDVEFEPQFTRADGSAGTRWVRYIPERDAEGGVVGFFALIEDISERKRTGQALQDANRTLAAEKELNQKIIDASPVGICIYDQSGDCIAANPSMVAHIGATLDQVRSQNYHRIESWKRTGIYELALKALASDEPKSMSVHTVSSFGKDVWLELIFCPLHSGNTRNLMLLTSDISENRRGEEARARLAAIVENSNDAIISRSLDGTILSWNVAAERLLGYSAAEAIGQSISIILPSGREADHLTNSGVLRAGGQIPPTEVVRRTKSGRIIDVLRSISPIKNEVGVVVGAAVIMHDITEIKRVATALATKTTVLTATMENMAQGISVVDGGLRLLAWNRRFIELLEFPKELLYEGVNLEELFRYNARRGEYGPGDPEEQVRSRVARALPPVPHVFERVRANGVVLEIRGQPMPGGGFVTTYTDITERKAAERAVVQLNAELEQRVTERTAELERANGELEAFTYSVSHDLRSPLRAINGFSSIILAENRAKLTSESVGYLQRVVAASNRMSMLIDDLLALSRVSRQDVRRRIFDYSALAAEVVAALIQAHPEPIVRVSIQPDMYLDADPGLMRIVVENLVGNAWKFSARADDALIEIGCEEREGGLVYFVRDNGAGFNMERATRLFEPFQRLHSDKDFEGTGIGLSIVQRIVTRHGGEVWAEGAVGRGATFRFTTKPGAPAQQRRP